MSSAINFIQNSLSIPSYNSRQQQIHSVERQITQIDKQLDHNNRLIAGNNEFQKIGGQLLSALEKNQALRIEHLSTLKESRDIEAKLLACYEKLLEIRKAKNDSNNSAITTYQDQPPRRNDITIDVNNTPTKRQFYIENVRALGRELESKAIKWENSKSPRLQEYNGMYIDFIKRNKAYVATIDGNTDKILSNKRILENYNHSLSGDKIGGRVEEDKIAQIIEENTNLQNLNVQNIKQIRQESTDYHNFINTKIESQAVHSTDKAQKSGQYYNQIENDNKPLKAKEQKTITTSTIQVSKPVDMTAITADATQKLGDVLFDNYKNNNQTLATNIREKFFHELEYDSSKNVASVNSSLEKVFDSFTNYLKIGEYSYLKGNDNFLTNLQNRLSSYNVKC